MNCTSTTLYVQFELTEACNHRCVFCYNDALHRAGNQLDTDQCKRLLDEMRAVAVGGGFVNFSGGEPLIRSDFFDIASHAKSLGFDIHLNTNATLIDERIADSLAGLFPSLCTSVLSSSPRRHDELVGSLGAFERMRQGVEHVLLRGMKVEINVCTFKGNYAELFDIAKVMASDGTHVFSVTEYINNSKSNARFILNKQDIEVVMSQLDKICMEITTYKEVQIHGPIPLCGVSVKRKEKYSNFGNSCRPNPCLRRISSCGDITLC
jgi:MoaA/NifB/PqqE/SkfB family radical SAM enzyme